MSGPRFGPLLRRDGAALRLWAPAARAVTAMLDRPHPMMKDDAGWFTVEVAQARAGTRYKFRIDDEIEVPDPASHFQPDDVSGPSEIIDHTAYPWRAPQWTGRPWSEAVILECHVGTFTPAGTYRAMIEKLEHLVDSGITAIELMPLADFAGARNWGYDGVLWYAPDHVYGTPDDLKTLIDEAHLRGLMVFLDVVYNHFGPEGNYLGRYAPQFFCDRQTPWGAAIDYQRPEVEDFAIENALHWLGHYRFDGLRLDAVHAIGEPGGLKLLAELSQAVGEFAQQTGRIIHLMLENDDNRTSLLDPTTAAPRGKYRAQWNDDYHHAWHVLLAGETHGYYMDYERPAELIARVLRKGFAYQGEASKHRGGTKRGEAVNNLPPTAFINFLQNHDQIGNRALGDRLEWSADPRAMEAALAVTLLAPMPPMLFMGEEFGARTPFPFFCDFRGELADAIRAGRRREFAQAYAAFGDEVPDPLALATFKSAVLNWSDLADAGLHRHAYVKRLLQVRRAEIVPRLATIKFQDADHRNGVLLASWLSAGDSLLLLQANLSDEPRPRRQADQGLQIWGRGVPDRIQPWSVFWSTREA